ncbi:MAG: 50S ribosomal protein L29 [Acidithiobacillus ferriphilus]|jgi:LSU ribosomal protein L29P|uniref:Large ribosomal subunit protein uL29 n=3 Tax=Acidithiobacillus TaxID=119977 RepID=A0A179BLK2_ACIFR|nr:MULTISPECIES: 50S ribosomal protein L29 [Acidithiobacillus]OYV81435.1 MAG: 50S ribosomal protein L29 [Acidithiobacillus ferrivorans]MBU2784326.1 50S ribosomal protein L29 [Acidithiobacillus ferriphilus]MBU2827709.1 50S ribosomal protein L29 [Acidithiobacillus ferriphilus]MBU2830246.1 50S ribosomal protein L29 [Acidithiobacillus ferriphilus]MBU2832321.1 50S ribosomal protein L29 [Acidithiobacillus ferriphilus]
MKAQEVQKLDLAGCQAQLLLLLEEQFKLRMQHATGQLAKTSRLRFVRRDIARVRTAITVKKEAHL